MCEIMKSRTAYLLALVYFWELAMASFHNDFNNVTRHTDLLLEWDPVNATDYPLLINMRVLNKTSDHEVNVLEMNITTGLTDNSFLWKDLPFPLPFLSTATYGLQVRRQQQPGAMISEIVIASSPSFAIIQHDGGGNNGWRNTMNGTASPPPKPIDSSHSKGPSNSNAAIAAGLVVPLVVGISVFVFVYMQRRQKRILEERQKARIGLVIE
ncbi:hypothetical protein HD806DRAFT_432722 [Xylariaceae sp. AK1471]|nr:hypothetical protein HD806DRAFT_432722 [Xylariaceae sp. AK1471]